MQSVIMLVACFVRRAAAQRLERKRQQWHKGRRGNLVTKVGHASVTVQGTSVARR